MSVGGWSLLAVLPLQAQPPGEEPPMPNRSLRQPPNLQLPPPPRPTDPGSSLPSAPPSSDPTQSPPNLRNILEGEGQANTQRQQFPVLEVAGKIVSADGSASAVLRINGRYTFITKGTRLAVGDETVEVQEIQETYVEVKLQNQGRVLQLH